MRRLDRVFAWFRASRSYACGLRENRLQGLTALGLEFEGLAFRALGLGLLAA